MNIQDLSLIESGKNDTMGCVYIMYNNAFKNYGENVYKIGSTKNIEQRLKSFVTCYIENVEIKYKTEQIKNYVLIEKIVHDKLEKYRINKKREFFNYPLDEIISLIKNINLMQEDEIKNYFINKKKSDDIYDDEVEIIFDDDPKENNILEEEVEIIFNDDPQLSYDIYDGEVEIIFDDEPSRSYDIYEDEVEIIFDDEPLKDNEILSV